MNILTGIKKTFLGMHKGIRRFPIAVLFTVVMTILVNLYIFEVYKNEVFISRALMVLGTGSILSLDIHLLCENLSDKIKSIWVRAFLQLIGILFLAWLFYFLDINTEELNTLQIIVYIGINLFLFIGKFYIAKFNKAKNYSIYVRNIILAILKAYIYAVVLLIGVFAILFSLDKLFNIYIDEKIYFSFANFILMLFATLIYLSSFPESIEYMGDIRMGKAFYILIMYITMPLLFIYTLILYAYFTKVILTSAWPNGLVGNLVLWYGLVSVFVVFWMSSLQNISSVVSKLKLIFTIAILPNIVILFMAIHIRIQDYGITVPRYYVVLGGIFIVISMLYYTLRRNSSNIFIPVLLSFLVLISTVTPIGAYNISRWNQNERLEKLLLSNNMIEDGQLKKNFNIADEDKYRIAQIVKYLSYNDMKIRYLPDDFDIYKDFSDSFGYDANGIKDYYDEASDNETANIYMVNRNEIKDISGFDRFLRKNIYTWDAIDGSNKGEDIYVEDNKLIIQFYDADKLLAVDKVGLDKIFDIVKKSEEKELKLELTNDVYYEGEVDGIKYKMIINSSTLERNKKTKEYKYIDLDIFLLYTVK